MSGLESTIEKALTAYGCLADKSRLSNDVTARPFRRLHGPLLAALLGSAVSASALAGETIDYTELSIEELSSLSIYDNSANVLTSHLHKAGEWMLGYTYRYIDMEHNHDGNDEVSVAEVLAEFPVAPTNMTMEMHMLSLMYAPSDRVTVMAMLPYMKMRMDHVTRMGFRFTTKSDGIGDLSLMVNTVVHRDAHDAHRVTLMGGVSLPTGSIDQRDQTPAGAQQQLPYPMQLGSGTYDLLLGGGYLGIREPWSWGINLKYTKPTGDNDRNYTLGDRADMNTWLSRAWAPWLSTSTKVHAHAWGNIDGADPELNPLMAPTADPKRRGGERVDLLFDVELYAPQGALRGQRLVFEIGTPIYKSLDGPQLQEDLRLGASWQWTF